MAHDEPKWREAIGLAHKYGLLLLDKEPDDSVGRLVVARADIETGHPEEAYRRFAGLGENAFTSELVDEFAAAMFFTDRQDELIVACSKAPATSKRTVCTYAALGAALKGDAQASAHLATIAAQDEHTDLRWVMDQVTARFVAPDTDVKRYALTLSQRIDTAQRTLDNKAVREALLDYVKQVGPNTP